MLKKPAFIFHYYPTSIYALNVLLGALESRDLDAPEIRLTKKLDELISAIDDFLVSGNAPIYVFWSFFSASFEAATEDLSRVRARFVESPVIHTVGGVHATAEPEATAMVGFDYVALGEGEVTITDFFRAAIEGTSVDAVRGLARIRDGAYRANGFGERIDLNDFPPFAIRHRRINPIEITRGCVYACKFCQTPFMFKARFRHRSVQNICKHVKEMKDIGLKDIRFITPTSLSYGSQDEKVHLDKIEELLAGVRSIIGTDGRLFFGSFPSEVRPEHVSPESMRILKKYVNNDNIIIGGQSGSKAVLEKSKRGHGVEEIERAVRYTVEAGFKPYVDFIFGLPGETERDAANSLRFADRLVQLGAKVHAHTFMPLPGTPFKLEGAGKVSEKSQKMINRISGRGGMYGHWEEQQKTAKRLAQFQTDQQYLKNEGVGKKQTIFDTKEEVQ